MRIDRNDLLHVESCALITVLAGCFLPWWGACATALGAGIGKEIWDRYYGGVSTWFDILFDVLGIVIGVSIVFLNRI